MPHYEFDPASFALTSLPVPRGIDVMGDILTIAGDEVVTIGEDVIVVATAEVMRLPVTIYIGTQPAS